MALRCLLKSVQKVQVVSRGLPLTLRSLSSGGQFTKVNYNNGVKTVALEDPKRRNALSEAMIEELRHELTCDLEEDDLRVIVLTAEGPVFSAGHDLKELTAEAGRSQQERIFSKCTEMMNLVQDVPVPVIASVRGHAAAAGCQLVASCDVVIAGDGAQFSTPGINVGLFCSTPGVAVTRAVGGKKSLEMLLTGWPVTAEEALTHGLVSRVVPDDQLEAETERVARRMCELSKSVLALGKRFYYQQRNASQGDAYRQGCTTMVENLQYVDCQEGINAFFQKRRPTWSHGDKTVQD